ncbi:hypothetical protein ACOME3_000855 [Neoechinorhynchus agilis]
MTYCIMNVTFDNDLSLSFTKAFVPRRFFSHHKGPIQFNYLHPEMNIYEYIIARLKEDHLFDIENQANGSDSLLNEKRKLSAGEGLDVLEQEGYSLHNRRKFISYIKNTVKLMEKYESGSHLCLQTATKPPYANKYNLFTQFDSGIKMRDDIDFFSVTPEFVAKQIAESAIPRQFQEGALCLDMYCGVGGNAIHFANRYFTIGIDHDPVALEYAKHNASIYETEKTVDLVLADCHYPPFRSQCFDLVFLSPPWGGRGYSSRGTCDIRCDELVTLALKYTWRLSCLYIPRTYPLDVLSMKLLSVANIKMLEFQQLYLKGVSKAICAYCWSDLSWDVKSNEQLDESECNR